jgi:hypothetical protein
MESEVNNDHDILADRELTIAELKKEIEALKEELRKYKEMYTNYFFNGKGFERY